MEKLENDITPLNSEPIKQSHEYASYIMDAIVNNKEININANVLIKTILIIYHQILV